tara:strand:- start:6 stop:236 length:231 start_codon:yes stop_codon:yes gene_type:complete
MTRELLDYLEEWNLKNYYGAPQGGWLMFEVYIVDECTGEDIFTEIWAESLNDLHYDLNGILGDCEVIEEINQRLLY